MAPKWETVLLTAVVFVTISDLKFVESWGDDELELFDLVEEVNQNFYELLGVGKDASTTDIKKAYRRLSLQLHPDKNKADDAEVKFRQLVAVYDILRDDEKRTRYNDVLENGLPTWRQPVYYYRRVRKMSILELVVFLFIISTGFHYVFLWSAYIEKKYEVEEVLTSRLKKKDKKSKKHKQTEEPDADEIIKAHIEQLPKPKAHDLLPCKLFGLMVFLIKSVPDVYNGLREKWTLRNKCPSDDEEDSESEDDQERIKKPRRKKLFEIPELPAGYILDPVDDPQNKVVDGDRFQTDENSTSVPLVPWCEEDSLALTRAIKKFPGGVSSRWEKIAEHIGRPVFEVVEHAKKLKNTTTAFTVSTSVQGITGSLEEALPVKKKVVSQNEFDITVRDALNNKPLKEESRVGAHKKAHNGAVRNVKDPQRTLMIKDQQPLPLKNKTDELESVTNDDAVDNWGQVQQRALELALSRFPKGTEERWERIAECVPDRTKEECILRYKHLVDLVKKKRQGS